MPGILYHLSFAEMVYDELKDVDGLDEIKFLSANLIPDLAEDKNSTHHYQATTVYGIVAPNLAIIRNILFGDRYTEHLSTTKMGLYCHLYLDQRFITQFLIPSFSWDETKACITNRISGKSWDAKSFFSQAGLYGAYSSVNQLLLRDGRVSSEKLEKIPDTLPQVGLKVFDNRREKTWRAELNAYPTDKPYTGEILDYDKLWGFIEQLVPEFIEELRSLSHL